MKKLLLASILATLSLFTFGQDSTASILKPIKGSQTLELEASSPFAAPSPFRLNNSSLRYRYFLSDKIALRVNVGFDINNSKSDNGGVTTTDRTINGNVVTTESGKTITSSEVFSFKFLPGIEIHKNVSKRVSVYYGGFIYLEMQSAKARSEQTYGSRLDGNSQKVYEGFGSIITESTGTTSLGNSNFFNPQPINPKSDFFRYGASIVSGADFYFTKSLYLGVEIGLGFTNTINSEATIKRTDTSRGVFQNLTSDPDPNASSITTTKLNENTNSLNLAPSATGNLRFGFKF